MKKKFIILIAALALTASMAGCDHANDPAAETKEPETIEEAEAVEESEKIEEIVEKEPVYPLPSTIDLGNLMDCTLAVSIERGGLHGPQPGGTNYTLEMMIYEYELFDLVDVSMLEVGSILMFNKEPLEISSLERNELGTVILNGGLDVGGYELVTNENGVYYSIGYSDMKTYHEVGEAELELSPDFVFIDASDLDAGEKIYTLEELAADDSGIDYSGTPHNTTVLVENGVVTSMKRVYVP